MQERQVFLFGSPRVKHNSDTIEISRRKTMALLAYLAVSGLPQTRDTLATLLWPDNDQSSARANLRRDLFRLKQALGGDALIIDREQAGINPDFGLWLDVEQFKRKVAIARDHGHKLHDRDAPELCEACFKTLREAVQLYTDDFMAGFGLPDSAAFDEWQFFQGEDLRGSLNESLQHLIRWHTRCGEYERGIEYARRWLALDTLREPAHRALMELYALAGQQAAAIRQYRECVRLLKEELGIEPDAETTRLYEAIRTKRFPAEAGRDGALTPHLETSDTPPQQRYREEELLAEGGYGEVYMGRDTATDQKVVIKRLKRQLITADENYVARFMRESELLQQINHPNIIKLLATYEADGQPTIVMEYVAGGSLRDLLDEQRQLPIEQAVDIALELADALSRAHHLGVIHRDIKPENVLLAQDGSPRLIDFGLARLKKDEVRLTKTGSFVGSPLYMSPEALRGEEIDPRSDIWSFGVLLYEMLAGRPPFQRAHFTPLLVNILEDPIPEVTSFRPDVPPALGNLLKRMLVKDRGARIASMRQVGAELEAIQAGQSLGLAVISTQERQTTGVRQDLEPSASLRPAYTPPVDLKYEQRIQFCTSFDGTRIAYATIGHGPPLVKAANYLSHLEYDWVSPVWRHWLEEFVSAYTFVRYDERGCGLSDWEVPDLSSETWVRDLEAVVDANGLERFPLIGISQGGPVAIAYTVRNPEKVSHLILYGTYARGWLKRDLTEELREEERTMMSLMRIGWGRDNPAFRQFFAAQFQPDATKEQMDALDKLMRVSATPENAAALEGEMHQTDVQDLAKKVNVPTLILHGKDDGSVPFEEGRLLAALIPGARFVPLESRNHILVEDEPAWPIFKQEVRQFLGTWRDERASGATSRG